MRAMMKKITVVMGVTLILGLSGNAGATISSLTFSDCGSFQCAPFSKTVSGGTFSDIYQFSVPSLSSLGAAVASLDFKTFSGISNMDMSLLNNSSVQLAHGTSFTYSNLSNGLYSFKVTGTAGPSGGFYAGNAFVVPVPEISTWAMMVIGIGMVGIALQRRIRSERDMTIANIQA